MHTNLTPFRFTAGTIEAPAVDVGHFVFVDKDLDNTIESFSTWLGQQVKDHPDKGRVVFFPYKSVKTFTVPENPRGYRIRYKIADGKRITSDQVYTADQINNIYFVIIREENYRDIPEFNRMLRNIAPEDFFFAFVHEGIEVFVVDGSVPATTEQDVELMRKSLEEPEGEGSSCSCGGNCGCGGGEHESASACGCH